LNQDWFQAINLDLASDEAVQTAREVVGNRFGDHIASVVHLAAYYYFRSRYIGANRDDRHH